jgi:hypothetical protein
MWPLSHFQPEVAGQSAGTGAAQALSAARAPVEHGFGDLKHWRILTGLRLDPAKATTHQAEHHHTRPADQPLQVGTVSLNDDDAQRWE